MDNVTAIRTAFEWHQGETTPALYQFATTRTIHNKEHRRQLIAEIKSCMQGTSSAKLEHLLLFVKKASLHQELCDFRSIYYWEEANG